MMMRKLLFFMGIFLVAPASFLILQGCMSAKATDENNADPITAFMQEADAGDQLHLFEGTGLAGWEKHGIGRWEWKDNVLKVSRGIGYLCTQYDQFTDILLSLEVRTSKEANSGVFFRSEHPGWGLHPWPKGYECQIDNHDPKNPTGSLYDRVTAQGPVPEDNEWFSMSIMAKENHIQLKVNQAVVVDVTDELHTKGFIALQAHDLFSTVEFKNVVLELPE